MRLGKAWPLSPAMVALAMTALALAGGLALTNGNAWGGPAHQSRAPAPDGSILATASAAHPSNRSGPAMAYDGKDGYVVLFGGCNGIALGDTWIFAHGVWTQLHPAVSPAARCEASMAYDAKDGYIVLFGGTTASGFRLDNTWKFSGGVWAKLNLAIHPSARNLAPLRYDPRDGYLLLFGGVNSTTDFSDTWKFVGGHWTRLFPSAHPTARYGSALAYDAKDGYTVLFGGFSDALGSALGDTWTYVGGSWSQIHPASAPAPSVGASAVFDPHDGYVVLFGVQDAVGNLVNQTWKFTAGTWVLLHPPASPDRRFYIGLAYDQKDSYVVLFGGHGETSGNALVNFDDTWKFANGGWTKLGG